MSWDELEDGEVEIDNSEEFLWRNCAESWLDEGVPSKQLFYPTKKDDKKLSSARSTSVPADEHFVEFRGLGNSSTGVWAVTVAEVQGESLRAVDDSATGSSSLTGHSYIDFRQCATGGTIQRAARTLKDCAVARGQLHPNDKSHEVEDPPS